MDLHEFRRKIEQVDIDYIDALHNTGYTEPLTSLEDGIAQCYSEWEAQ
ncbi:MAG: hypothetical protein JSV03_09085 [Planctomycetota bacterium]|nr:MAG: hypothetical protein JSV03_09085 [Planctomycetota bacterium]